MLNHEHEHGALLKSVQDNLSFILVALFITAAVMLLSKLAETAVSKKARGVSKGWNAKKIVGIGVFSALGGALALLEIQIPLIPGFYMLDLSEIAGMMAAFLLGPLAGVLVEFIKTILHILIHGTHSVFVGDFAAFVMGSAYVLPASLIYLRNKSRKTAVSGLVVGSLVLIVFGAFFNGFYLIPKFADLYGIPLEGLVASAAEANSKITSIWTLIAFATIPFNLLKALVDSVIVFLIYKPLSNLYRRIG